MRLFTVLDSTALVGILKGDGFFPLGIILTFLLDKRTLVLEAVEEDLTVHQTIRRVLLNAEPSKRRRQIQDRIKAIGVNHVNHTQSIGLQPVGGIIRQDLGIWKSLDDLIQHQNMTERLGSKDRSLTNVSLHELRSWTIHASAIQHGFGIIDTNLRNIRFTEPTRIRSCSTRSIQESQLIFIHSIQGNLTNRCTNLTHDIGCVKQGVLKGRLELVPGIFHQNALAFLVFKSLDNSLD